MLMPKRTKHRKTFRIRYEGKARGNTELHFGSYGLMAKEGAWVTANQIKKGKILFEIDEVTEDVAREALRLASHKLPIKCSFVKKEESGDKNEN